MDDIREAIKRQNAVVEDWLIHYPERQKEYADAKEEITCPWQPTDENVGGGRSNIMGSPTERTGLALAGLSMGDAAKWLRVVEDVCRIVGPKKRLLIEIRQEQRYCVNGGRPNWTAYACSRFAEEGWNVSEKKISDNWHGILELAARVAVLRGCDLLVSRAEKEYASVV